MIDIINKKLVDFFEKRPEISEKFSFPGTFREYAASIGETVTKDKKDGLLTEEIVAEAGRILGDKIPGKALRDQLTRYPLFSYADHHGLLNHQLLYNSNILYSIIIRELELPFVVVLATGNIPLKNISYPRGFYFKKEKFNFFKNKLRDIPVYLLDEKLQADKEKGLESIVLNLAGNSLSGEEKKFLEYLFFECLEIDNAGRDYGLFSDQVTFLNYKLWKYYFAKETRESIPDIVYLQSNRILSGILEAELKREKSLISRIVFDPRVRDIFIDNFNGIRCCWGENMGSQLFWGITEKKKYIPLRLDKETNSLQGDHFNLFLEPDVVVAALKNKEILPTIFFDFLIITFWEHYMALGGLNQIEFLPRMQEAHVKGLNSIGMKAMADHLKTHLANGYICGMYPFDFDSGIDLLWHFNSSGGKFNGNMDGGLTHKHLDKIADMLMTELVSTGIDKCLDIF